MKVVRNSHATGLCMFEGVNGKVIAASHVPLDNYVCILIDQFADVVLAVPGDGQEEARMRLR
jgi:hypothetical protein